LLSNTPLNFKKLIAALEEMLAEKDKEIMTV
jgi:hypothetical protein